MLPVRSPLETRSRRQRAESRRKVVLRLRAVSLLSTLYRQVDGSPDRYDMNRFLIFAHRGASAHARGNTLEAYAIAVEHGADGIELDARLTRDGVLILEHEVRPEPELPPFIDLDFAELRNLAPWVPTLDEAWDVIGPTILVNIELKNRPDEVDYDRTHRLAKAVAEWIRTSGDERRILLSSFNYDSLDVAKGLTPGVSSGVLVMPGTDPGPAIAYAREAGHETLNLWIDEAIDGGKDLVEAAGDLDVLVYTVNDPEQAQRLRAAGYAGIFTDDPKMMREALSARS